MPHSRYFCEETFTNGQTVSLTGDECHHLVRVLRARPGESIELVNGRGQLALAKIEEVSKHSAELFIENVVEEKAKTSLILAMGIPRMNHLEWVIEKGTELNATAFWLFPGILSEKETLSDSQRERAKHLAVSAMKQCGRLDLPAIEIKSPLLEWPALSGTLLFGDTDEDAPYVWDVALEKPLTEPIIWFIGPEKGFESRERAFLLNSMKAKGVRLHPNILRTETAPLVALSLSQLLIN